MQAIRITLLGQCILSDGAFRFSQARTVQATVARTSLRQSQAWEISVILKERKWLQRVGFKRLLSYAICGSPCFVPLLDHHAYANATRQARQFVGPRWLRQVSQLGILTPYVDLLILFLLSLNFSLPCTSPSKSSILLETPGCPASLQVSPDPWIRTNGSCRLPFVGVHAAKLSSGDHESLVTHLLARIVQPAGTASIVHQQGK
ncbi:hypothetical protein HDK90DRAFT_349476 [Phyllosticta capitalensis]|uniref:Uncharacterized protein n=1 Tax=Phyllosticta capitalensis TaxID=121624 RepID=A0ABR1YGL1_9PEZI